MTVNRNAAIGRFSMSMAFFAIVASTFSLTTSAEAAHRRPRAHAAQAANDPVEMTNVARRVAEVAGRHGVPARFAIAVARVESHLRCHAVGRAGELGPLQIKPATARGLGYTGPTSALNSCDAGLEWGMRHLAIAYKRCGTSAGAAALHNRGLGSACVNTAYSNAVVRMMASL
jgi:soluble lytic murein transglycosylase-like protein